MPHKGQWISGKGKEHYLLNTLASERQTKLLFATESSQIPAKDIGSKKRSTIT